MTLISLSILTNLRKVFELSRHKHISYFKIVYYTIKLVSSYVNMYIYI